MLNSLLLYHSSFNLRTNSKKSIEKNANSIKGIVIGIHQQFVEIVPISKNSGKSLPSITLSDLQNVKLGDWIWLIGLDQNKFVYDRHISENERPFITKVVKNSVMLLTKLSFPGPSMSGYKKWAMSPVFGKVAAVEHEYTENVETSPRLKNILKYEWMITKYIFQHQEHQKSSELNEASVVINNSKKTIKNDITLPQSFDTNNSHYIMYDEMGFGAMREPYGERNFDGLITVICGDLVLVTLTGYISRIYSTKCLDSSIPLKVGNWVNVRGEFFPDMFRVILRDIPKRIKPVLPTRLFNGSAMILTAINGTEYDGDTMVGYSVKLGKIFDVNKFLQDGDIGNKVLVWCYLKYLSDENRVIWAIRFIEKRFYPLAQKIPNDKPCKTQAKPKKIYSKLNFPTRK
ncbi:unnamed protein product [Dracunculus medinensis]|uniref:CABIT domain-containing protein n=1 Tax=Dracunculus medinensis TaxID=318479 RepID=A0A0N4UKC0_DRAME|nr:unnamed protein product [Dracunculus medinensis]